MTRPIFGGAAVALALAAPAFATAGEAPRLALDGTELRLVEPDGRIRAGEDLVGGELGFVDAYGPRRLRIEATERDGDGPSAIRLYEFSILDPATGRWGGLCRPGPDGRTAAFPIPGYFDDGGRYVADPARFTLACTGGAIGKCVRFGYRPWDRAGDGTALAAHYQTCVRMIRADYCGDGRGWTRNGTPVELHDAVGVLAEAPSPELDFEAAWGPDGAHCVAHVRVPENGSLDDLVRACPRLAGKVGTDACPADIGPGRDGILIVNKS